LFKINLNKLTLSELSYGEHAQVVEFLDQDLSLIFNDLGLFQGESVELSNIAPLGDPICIKVRESLITLRKKDAKTIIIQKLAE